jgi:hypothetical protein
MPVSRRVLALAAGLLGAAVSVTAAGATARLEMDTEALTMTGWLSGRVMPRSGSVVEFTAQRPAGIQREPAYLGTPFYGKIVVGNGPRSGTWVVVDRAPDDRRADNRIYLDYNQNGDLSDDGDGVWQNVGKNLKGARVGPHFTTVRGSWGEGGKETSTADYGLMLLFGADRAGVPRCCLRGLRRFVPAAWTWRVGPCGSRWWSLAPREIFPSTERLTFRLVYAARGAYGDASGGC